jgi:hypothetical protein
VDCMQKKCSAHPSLIETLKIIGKITNVVKITEQDESSFDFSFYFFSKIQKKKKRKVTVDFFFSLFYFFLKKVKIKKKKGGKKKKKCQAKLYI